MYMLDENRRKGVDRDVLWELCEGEVDVGNVDNEMFLSLFL